MPRGTAREKTFKLTPKLRAEAPRLAIYELQMFFASLRSWNLSYRILDPWLRWLLNNQRLETTLVHARNLLDFFERTPAKREKGGTDDVLSSDMGFPAKPIRGSASLRRNINKRLAHLSYTRRQFSAPEAKQWSSEIFQPLRERCADFLTAKDPNKFVAKHADPEAQKLWAELVYLAGH